MDTTLHITGMTCDACVRHVSVALAAVPGADTVSVDLASGTARITGTPELDALHSAVTDAGYQIAPSPANAATPTTGGCGCGSGGGGCGSRG